MQEITLSASLVRERRDEMRDDRRRDNVPRSSHRQKPARRPRGGKRSRRSHPYSGRLSRSGSGTGGGRPGGVDEAMRVVRVMELKIITRIAQIVATGSDLQPPESDMSSVPRESCSRTAVAKSRKGRRVSPLTSPQPLNATSLREAGIFPSSDLYYFTLTQ